MAIGPFYEIDLFKNVAESCLQSVLENSRILEVGAGHVFFSAGQTGRGLFLLEKGSVQTFRVCGDRKIAIATLRPPTVFGLGCFGGRHYLSSESLEASQVRVIAYESIKALMECSPNFAHGVIGLITKRFDGFLRELETHTLRGTLPRLATLLLTKEEEDVVSGLTHKDLAQVLGIHRESVTAALGELQKADIITIGRKRIRILHRARLERATRE
jgi:CRP/FNR family cyclic AMP-dependent transcriptional regulator